MSKEFIFYGPFPNVVEARVTLKKTNGLNVLVKDINNESYLHGKISYISSRGSVYTLVRPELSNVELNVHGLQKIVVLDMPVSVVDSSHKV